MSSAGARPIPADAMAALIASAGDHVCVACSDGMLRSLNHAGLALLGIPDLDAV